MKISLNAPNISISDVDRDAIRHMIQNKYPNYEILYISVKEWDKETRDVKLEYEILAMDGSKLDFPGASMRVPSTVDQSTITIDQGTPVPVEPTVTLNQALSWTTAELIRGSQDSHAVELPADKLYLACHHCTNNVQLRTVSMKKARLQFNFADGSKLSHLLYDNQ